MEVDNEVSGNGNSYTTEFRQYDPRLGRWKSLDPLMAMFPHMSPYCAFDNNPVYFTDPYGLSSQGVGDPPSKEERGKMEVGDSYEYLDDDGNVFNVKLINIRPDGTRVWRKRQAHVLENATASANHDTTPNTIADVSDEKYYFINDNNYIEEAPHLACNCISGSEVIELYYASIEQTLAANDEVYAAVLADIQAYQNEEYQRQLQADADNITMMSNPITAMYSMSGVSAGVSATNDFSRGEVGAGFVTLGMELLPGPTEDVIRSVRKGVTDFNRGSRKFRLVQGNRSSGWKHIFDRHVSRSRFLKKSKFDASMTEDQIIDAMSMTIKHGKEISYNGLPVFVKRLKYNGKYQTYRATVNTDGTVRTFHPLD